MTVGLLEAIRGSWRTVLAVTLVAGLLGLAVSALLPSTYEAQTRLYLANPQAGGIFGSVPPFGNAQNNTLNEAQQVTSPQVLEAAAAQLGDGLTADDLEDQVSATAAPQSDMIQIRATASTPERAVQIADGVGRAYEALATQERQAAAQAAIGEIENERAELEAQAAQFPEQQAALGEQIADLEARARQLAVDSGVVGSGIYRFQPAQVPESPASPLLLVNTLVAALLGLLLAAALVWWRAEHRRDVHERLDAADLLQAPLLGVIPNLGNGPDAERALVAPAPGSEAERAFEFITSSLRSALRRRLASDESPSLLVAGVRHGAGATLSAWNIGIAAARGHQRVILVDADFRTQGLTRLAGLEPSAGLSETVEDGASAPVAHTVDAATSMQVVPTGSASADPFGIITSETFGSAIWNLRGISDFLLLDAPPPLDVADTLAVADAANGVVLVVDRGVEVRALEELRLLLSNAGVPLLGYIFNEHTARPRPRRAAETAPRQPKVAERVEAAVATMAQASPKGSQGTA